MTLKHGHGDPQDHPECNTCWFILTHNVVQIEDLDAEAAYAEIELQYRRGLVDQTEALEMMYAVDAR